MADFETLRESFNQIAALYDEVRPSYDQEVIDAIVSFAQLVSNSRILEIGCGTGQITIPFAHRGYSIVALEPGDALASIAARKALLYPNVTIVENTFEAWPLQFEAFHLVLSAQAFHWIEPYFGVSKVAQALRKGGTLALVWNNDVSEDTLFYKRTQPIYHKFLPQEGPVHSVRSVISNAIENSGWFENIHQFVRPWQESFSTAEYLKRLNTSSEIQTLPEPRKSEFLRVIAAIAEEAGGTVARKYETQIVLARKRIQK
jgi:SAM-dependent methyltransferase